MRSNRRIIPDRRLCDYSSADNARVRQIHERMTRFTFLTPQLLSSSPMPLPTAYDFCWRTCPVYAIGDYRGLTKMDIHFLTWLIVGAWYPYYIPALGNQPLEERGWKYGNFLVKFIGCWEEDCITSLPEVIEAHGKLCGLVEETLKIAGQDPTGVQDGKKENHEEWMLMPLFRKIMIVLDKSDWWLEGVLLVAVQQGKVDRSDAEARPSLQTGVSGVIDLEFLEGEEYVAKVGPGIYRVKIDRAIEVVMELQGKEDEANGHAGLREVGKGENAEIGCSVAEWMQEMFGVADYDNFGFREDIVRRAGRV